MTPAATVAGDGPLRLFLALELPAGVSAALARWSREHLASGRPVAAHHLTLAFLGRQPRAVLEDVVRVLRHEAAATTGIRLAPLRYRETRSVGMLVLSDDRGRAAGLARRVQAGLEALDVYRRERRAWLPHVTVVRFREPLRAEPPLPRLEPFAPSGAAAFLSRLHPSGARYEVLESCPLGNGERGG